MSDEPDNPEGSESEKAAESGVAFGARVAGLAVGVVTAGRWAVIGALVGAALGFLGLLAYFRIFEFVTTPIHAASRRWPPLVALVSSQ
jgi:hypothetical protein